MEPAGSIKIALERFRQAENQLHIRQEDLSQLNAIDPNAQLRLLEVQVKQAKALVF